MTGNSSIRKATAEDAQGIIDIYYHWKGSFIDNDPDKKYFTLKNPFTVEQVEKICRDGFATVAANGDLVTSFYFLNPYFDPGDLEQRKNIVRGLIGDGKIPDGRYACSLLSSTHPDYQAQGLSNKTLHLLRDQLKDQYDYFAGIMTYLNTGTHKSSLKMGWRHYGDVGIGLLALIGTTDALTLKLDRLTAS